MLFSSISFLYYFLPFVILLYFIVPKAGKNVVLFLTSIVFYAWGEPRYVFLMLLEIVLGYIYGLCIEKFRGTKLDKLFLCLSVSTNIGFLGYFKYADFFIENINRATGRNVSLLHIVLPIGISFYTFQLLSYTIDVYRGTVKAQHNFLNLATYIAMFPQLIAGPIVRYADIEKQLTDRKSDFDKVALGVRRFLIGLSKKVLISNSLGELCDIFRESNEKSILFYWIYAIAFTLHIYFDFSGYSDMAIGLGKIFGFDFMENFNYPYISKSITEFWRRWHISLGTWFRDYVYIPLGGNRVRKSKWIFNIIVVWLLTGFWHGAAWNFIVWGLYFAFFLLIEKYFLLTKLEKCKVLNHIYVLLTIIFGFVIFNATDMKEAIVYIVAMLGKGSVPAISNEAIYYLKSYGLILFMAMVGATPAVSGLIKKIKKKSFGENVVTIIEPIFFITLLVLVTAYLVDGSFNPFLYFRF